MAKKTKKKKRVPHSLTQKNTSSARQHLTRSKGIFLEAMRGEAFGPHPGLVEVRMKLFVYNPIAKREVRLSDKQIDLLVGSIGEVDAMLKVVRKALEDWIRGYTAVS